MNLGISGKFGQEKPCTEEDPKEWYDPNEKWFWRLVWEGGYFSDPQELEGPNLSVQNSFYIIFSKTRH